MESSELSSVGSKEWGETVELQQPPPNSQGGAGPQLLYWGLTPHPQASQSISPGSCCGGGGEGGLMRILAEECGETLGRVAKESRDAGGGPLALHHHGVAGSPPATLRGLPEASNMDPTLGLVRGIDGKYSRSI